MNYLLDTCVVSALATKQPDQKVVRWIDEIEEARLFLSVITIGEIRKGIEKLRDPQRKAALRAWLNEQLLVRFGERIVPVDTEVMLRWGELTAALELVGKVMPAIDSLIAATALHGGFALVTRNEEDFGHAGVTIINPWK